MRGKRPVGMIVDCAIYEDGERRAGDLDVSEGGRAGGGETTPACAVALPAAPRAAGDATPPSFVGLGAHEPTPEEFDAVAREFDLHELAVEDAVEAHERPKLEVYGETLFVVLKTVRYIDSEEVIRSGEIMLFVNPAFVITVRHGEG